MVAKAPIAADSVGVAQPADIDATTMTKIDTSGTTYSTNGRKRLPARGSSLERAWAARASGLSLTRTRCRRRRRATGSGRASRRRSAAWRSRCPTGCRAARSAPRAGSACPPRRSPSPGRWPWWGDSRAPASPAASGCPASQWWRWSSPRSPRRPCRPPPRRPRGGPAPARIRRSTPSITLTARPVWNSTSPIRMNSGIGVSEKLVTETDAVARELLQPGLAAEPDASRRAG